MRELRVVVPAERSHIVRFKQEEMPGVMNLNGALVAFEPKIVFRWHLSVWIELTDLIDNGMPSQAQRDLIDPFGDMLDCQLKGSDLVKPNALFLARVTWNASCELIYRVHDPEPVDAALQAIIANSNFPCEFNFRIDDDPLWAKAEWHLNAARHNQAMQSDRPLADR